MSLRVRLALLLAASVSVALLAAWSMTRRVFVPFTERVMEAHLGQVLYLADAVEQGADARALGAGLGLEVHLVERAPRRLLDAAMRGGRCGTEARRGRELLVCRGPRAPVAVKLRDRWLVVRRDLDGDAPARRLGWVFLVLAGAVVAVAVMVATVATRPLAATVTAMRRVAEGDLSHRLPESGGPELAGVARAFNAMAERVGQLLRSERELMAGMSHELRTPLTRLRLELELLRDGATPSPTRLDAMEADVGELDRLIGELLELSRYALGERRLDRAPVGLREIAEEAVARAALTSHAVTIAGEGGEVSADRARLVRALENVVANAGKYAPPGSEVQVRLEPAAIEVRDRGPGVPPDELPRLFEPFYRGARARSGSATGLGLGLMIARQVLELHGGRLVAANLPGGGLAVRLELEGPAPDPVDR